MFDSMLRPIKDIALKSLLRPLIGKIHPNMVTITAFILGLASAWFLCRSEMYLSLVFWILNRIVDGMDGLLARLSNKVSDFGAYLDIMLDFIIYAAIPISLVLSPEGQVYLMPVAVMLAVFYVNAASWMYLSALLEKRSKIESRMTSVIMPGGLVEGTETIVLYSLIIAVPAFRLQLIWILTSLTALGFFTRFVWASRKLLLEDKLG